MPKDSLDLICYKYDGWQPRLRPGSPKRAWMDATNERYAYRCLPLTIANSHGWELLSPMAFEAKWDGRDAMEGVEIRMDPGYSSHLSPVTLFGYGTITFHVEAIFRTPPGWNLAVSGPPNRQKDAIQALGGVIETDWSPYTFTMNWRFTRPDQWIRFEENEPIAFLFPVERGALERFKPRIERLEDEPELQAAFEKWSASRNAFQKWVQEANPIAAAEKWQKLYFRGLDADGNPAPVEHQSKMRLPPFRFPDGKAMEPAEEQACPFRNRTEAMPAPQLETRDFLEAERLGATANVLYNPTGSGGAAMGLGNPALALALNRIGLNAKPQPLVDFDLVGPRTDRDKEHALERRDWLLDVQSKLRQLSPRGQEIERVTNLSADEFLDRFYAVSRPVVLTGALKDWPALERWTREYLGELVTAEDAAARIDGDVGTLDDYLTPGSGALRVADAGDFAPLGCEFANRLVAQVVGSQHVTLLPPSESRRLYEQGRGTSPVRDITDENQLARYPLARDAFAIEVELQPGDALFVPVGWWRQSIAMDFSATVTFDNFLWPNDWADSFPSA